MLPQAVSIRPMESLTFAETVDDEANIDAICASTNHL